MSTDADRDSIVAFYRGRRPDGAGRLIQDIWAFDHQALEAHHDFVQWLFPLGEASPVNPGAPTVSSATTAAFEADPELRAGLRRGSQCAAVEFPG